MAQAIPQLFQDIVSVDRELEAIRALPVIPFKRMTELLWWRQGARRDAERMLRWNTDKGSTA